MCNNVTMGNTALLSYSRVNHRLDTQTINRYRYRTGGAPCWHFSVAVTHWAPTFHIPSIQWGPVTGGSVCHHGWHHTPAPLHPLSVISRGWGGWRPSQSNTSITCVHRARSHQRLRGNGNKLSFLLLQRVGHVCSAFGGEILWTRLEAKCSGYKRIAP